jgi:excisionase family DNA binding protein
MTVSRKPLPNFLTVDEVAETINVSTRTVHRLIETEALAAHHFGRSVRVSEDDLAAYLAISRR